MKNLLHLLVGGVLITSVAGAGTLANISFTTLPVVNQNGTYNGAAGANINYPTLNLTVSTSVYCDDYNDTTNFPSGPVAYTASLLGTSDQEKYGLASSTAYEEAALLLVGDGSTLSGLANAPTSNPGLVTLYQYALWDLLGNSVPTFTYNGVSSATLVTTAKNDVTANASAYTNQYKSVVIFTPNHGVSGQEFLGVDTFGGGNAFPNTSIPEPATWAMLIGGLTLMGLKIVRRPRASQTT